MIIDRFEGEYAVVENENGELGRISRQLLPQNAKEGSVIEIRVNDNETENRKKTVREKMNSLFQD